MGAPKGNANALKHGLYAKHFNPTEQTELRKMSPEDFRHELYMMRVVVKNLFDLQKRLCERINKMPEAEQAEEMETLAKISNSLSLAVTALNNTARTYALFHGKDTVLQDSFEKALNSLPIFLKDEYLGETNQENEAGEEILVLPDSSSTAQECTSAPLTKYVRNRQGRVFPEKEEKANSEEIASPQDGSQ